jgi:hypothetical protein
MHTCSDSAVWHQEECFGETAMAYTNGADFGSVGEKRVWLPADINFDWFGGAMQAVWVIACSNDWPLLLWQVSGSLGIIL